MALLHKPFGMISSIGDKWNRLTLDSLHQTHKYLRAMHPVGRLDANTTGLLLFSSNGTLTEVLLNPKSNIPRQYEAVVHDAVDLESLRATLKSGVNTTEGTFAADLQSSEPVAEEQVSVCDRSCAPPHARPPQRALIPLRM